MGEEIRDVFEEWLDGPGLATLDCITAGSLDVLGITDSNYIVRYVNWTAPGITRESTIGRSVFLLVPPASESVARTAFSHVLETGEPTRFETLFSSEFGMMIWEVRVGPIVFEDQVIGFSTISTDVTEQRRATIDRDRFFSLSLDMLVVVRPDGTLRSLNPAFGQTLGYKVNELEGKRFIDLVHPDDVERTQTSFQNVLAGGLLPDFENRYRRLDGSYRDFSWRSTVDPITGDVYAVARDITVHRTIESQLRHAQKMEAVGQLAGGIAHDFNNLMQAVFANVELAMEPNLASESLLSHLREIEEAAQRAAELTKQLLVFSRRQPLAQEPIDLNSLLSGLMRLLRRLLPEDITLQFLPGPHLAAASVDRTQIEQVIVNLCVNARDAMEAGGKLTLATSEVAFDKNDCEINPWAKVGNYLCLSVTDTGVGMTSEIRERIFDPFFTTKSQLSGGRQAGRKAQHGGTGLGLSTLYGIVDQHGGMVHVYSEVGQGSTFRIYLPASKAPTSHSEAEIPKFQLARGHETILIAEDEEIVRNPVLRILQAAGYLTLEASNGREAMAMLNDHLEEIDLVVLDVVMPEVGGAEAWKYIRSIRPDLGVLFTSGYADSHYRALLPDDAEVIDKPFRSEELLRRIREKLDAGSDL